LKQNHIPEYVCVAQSLNQLPMELRMSCQRGVQNPRYEKDKVLADEP